MLKCKNCLLISIVPGANIDSNGICAFCRAFLAKTKNTEEEARRYFAQDLETTLKDLRTKPGYHVLACLSGGKDSLYLLYKLKVEYGLNVLAYTTDVNIPPIAWKNIERSIKKLDIDHLVYRPSESLYKKLFRYLLKNQEERGAVYTVSYVYAPLFEGDALRTAVEKNIPIVMAGYSPGQPEPERMIYEFSRELIESTDWTPPELKISNEFSDEELGRFWNPLQYPPRTRFPRYLAPFHAWEYNQDKVMKSVVELGLAANKRHASPIMSNYPINWLLMYSDLQHFGYNPYLPEFAKLIREGKANRLYWKIMGPVVDFMIKHKIFLGKEVQNQMNLLELKQQDLCINKSKGAYDPPLIAKKDSAQ